MDDDRFFQLMHHFGNGDWSCKNPFGWFPHYCRGGDELDDWKPKNINRMKDWIFKAREFLDEFDRRLNILAEEKNA